MAKRGCSFKSQNQEEYARRCFLKTFSTLALGSYFSLISASCSNGGKRKVTNHRPQLAAINQNYDDFSFNDGEVGYSFIGGDRDRDKLRLFTKYNNESWEEHLVTDLPNLQDGRVSTGDTGGILLPFDLEKTIEKRINTMQAFIKDEHGRTSSILEDELQAPTKTDAHALIKNILDNNREEYIEYEENPTITFALDRNERETLRFNFKIKKLDTNPVLIKYVDIIDDLETNLEERRFVREQRLHSLYIYRAPIEVVRHYTQKFIDNGFIDSRRDVED